MKRIALVVLSIACSGIPALLNAAPASQPKTLHAEGCVVAGVENRCLLVKDLKTGVLLNVLIKDPKPKIGDGIEFTAVPHDGPTVCMQGAAVEVTAWSKKDSLKCSQSGAHKQ
jgi:hypothetical protein